MDRGERSGGGRGVGGLCVVSVFMSAPGPTEVLKVGIFAGWGAGGGLEDRSFGRSGGDNAGVADGDLDRSGIVGGGLAGFG